MRSKSFTNLKIGLTHRFVSPASEGDSSLARGGVQPALNDDYALGKCERRAYTQSPHQAFGRQLNMTVPTVDAKQID